MYQRVQRFKICISTGSTDRKASSMTARMEVKSLIDDIMVLEPPVCVAQQQEYGSSHSRSNSFLLRDRVLTWKSSLAARSSAAFLLSSLLVAQQLGLSDGFLSPFRRHFMGHVFRDRHDSGVRQPEVHAKLGPWPVL